MATRRERLAQAFLAFLDEHHAVMQWYPKEDGPHINSQLLDALDAACGAGPSQEGLRSLLIEFAAVVRKCDRENAPTPYELFVKKFNAWATGESERREAEPKSPAVWRLPQHERCMSCGHCMDCPLCSTPRPTESHGP